MGSARQAFARGARDVAPILLGVAPFGLVVGVAAAETGLAPLEAGAFSAVVFAGASQLAILDLLARGTPALAVGTALLINLRFVMYGASLAPYLADVPLRRRLAAAYVLVDQSYALSVVRYAKDPHAGHRLAYFAGTAAPLWVAWLVTTSTGAAFGGAVPAWLPLGFAIPLTFLALLVPTVTDRPAVAAALVGAGVAVALAGLPANLGLMLAAVSGIAAGTLADLRMRS